MKSDSLPETSKQINKQNICTMSKSKNNSMFLFCMLLSLLRLTGILIVVICVMHRVSSSHFDTSHFRLSIARDNHTISCLVSLLHAVFRRSLSYKWRTFQRHSVLILQNEIKTNQIVSGNHAHLNILSWVGFILRACRWRVEKKQKHTQNLSGFCSNCSNFICKISSARIASYIMYENTHSAHKGKLIVCILHFGAGMLKVSSTILYRNRPHRIIHLCLSHC